MSDIDEYRNMQKQEKVADNGSNEEFEWYLSLTDIKGIGKETVEDIGRIYNNIQELKNALIRNEVPLRNDVVKKLKSYLIN